MSGCRSVGKPGYGSGDDVDRLPWPGTSARARLTPARLASCAGSGELVAQARKHRRVQSGDRHIAACDGRPDEVRARDEAVWDDGVFAAVQLAARPRR